MKRYTPQLISRWTKNPKGISHARNPQPFPGKCPTRIMLNALLGGESYNYIGKPSNAAFKGFRTFINKPIIMNRRKIFAQSKYYYIEFDRNGIVLMSHNMNEGMAHKFLNAKLWIYYHPEILADYMPNWVSWPYKRVENSYYRVVSRS